jgi:hypothetical protein
MKFAQVCWNGGRGLSGVEVEGEVEIEQTQVREVVE